MKVKFKKSIYVYIHMFSLSLLNSCGGSCYKEEFNQIKEKYKCDNIDDCKTKYEFEGARSYLALMKQTNKNSSCESIESFEFYSLEKELAVAEMSYYISMGEVEKAEQTANETGNQYEFQEILNKNNTSKIKKRIKELEENLKKYLKSKDFDSIDEYVNLIIPTAGKNEGRCGDSYFKGYKLTSAACCNENSSYTEAKNCFNEKLKNILLKMKLEGFNQKQIDYLADLYMPDVVEKGQNTSRLDYSEKNKIKQQLK